MAGKRAKEYLDRFNQLKAERDAEWNSLFQELSDYIMPRKSNINLFKNSADRKDLKIYNETAKLANGKLAAGLYAFLCPAGERWFTLEPSNDKLKKNDRVKRWFAEVTRIMFESLGNSNFSLSAHEFFLDLSCFGTACEYIAEDTEKGIMFRNFHIANIYVLENHKEEIDTVFRYFRLSARQAIQMFGEDNVHRDIKKAVADNKGEQEFEFVHIVHPREEYDGNKIDDKNMPWASIYIDIEHSQIVEEGGYREMPYLVSRFTKATGSVYGSGPGQDALATIKLVNLMDRDIMLETERKVDPPWTSPDEESLIDNSPGGITYYNSQTGAKPEPVDLKSDIQIGREEVERKEQFIARAFYNDLFEILADRKNMTATEVMERVKERLIAFSPTLGRMQNEYFARMIHRDFGILFRRGEFPEPPQELMLDPTYEIKYNGELALLARKLENAAFMESIEPLLGIAEQRPEILDNYDFDKITQGLAHNNGVPMDWLRSEEDRDALRAARQQAQEQAQQQEQLLAAADAVPKLSKAPEAGSPVEKLLAAI